MCLIVQDEVLVRRLEKLCDAAVVLESFSGSDKEENPLYQDYHGTCFCQFATHARAHTHTHTHTHTHIYELKELFSHFCVKTTNLTHLDTHMCAVPDDI